jgi:hypothetical protein
MIIITVSVLPESLLELWALELLCQKMRLPDKAGHKTWSKYTVIAWDRLVARTQRTGRQLEKGRAEPMLI